jgi:hypothetical protein
VEYYGGRIVEELPDDAPVLHVHLRALERRLIERIIALTTKEETDLANATATITAAVNSAVTTLQTLAGEVSAAAASGDPAAMEAAATSLNGLASTLSAAVAAAQPAQTTAPAALAFISGASLPGATVGQAYSDVIGVGGGTAPYSVSSNPTSDNGVSIDASGNVTGTPVNAQVSTFQVTVTDSASPPATVTESFTLVAAPAAGS